MHKVLSFLSGVAYFFLTLEQPFPTFFITPYKPCLLLRRTEGPLLFSLRQRQKGKRSKLSNPYFFHYALRSWAKRFAFGALLFSLRQRQKEAGQKGLPLGRAITQRLCSYRGKQGLQSCGQFCFKKIIFFNLW
jgi:hypothetical protein